MNSGNAEKNRVNGSFRDPSGFLFNSDGVLYRRINTPYKEHYDHFIDSGLYNALLADEAIIPHEEVLGDSGPSDNIHKIIRPERLSFISYPYEWCFSQLKDAALTTLLIQKKSLEYGMTLKDSSAYNIQFRRGKPVFIDTLSFEKDSKTLPWIAYRQFCQHFLAPLALTKYRDARLNQLTRIFIDGIPLDLASRLLPLRARFNAGLFVHIFLHAKYQKKYSGGNVKNRTAAMSSSGKLGLIDNLYTTVKNLRWECGDTEWGDYYDARNYSTAALNDKKRIVSGFIDSIKPCSVWDLGSNTGLFSRIASEKGIPTISFDIDPKCVEKNYREAVAKRETHILPLLMDLANPSPGIGWQNSERDSFIDRGPVDTVLALALIHHLAISNNLPLEKIAGFFSKICRFLIIEFVPKEDPRAQRLLGSRKDIFTDYTQQNFEHCFKERFTVTKTAAISTAMRTLYLMENILQKT